MRIYLPATFTVLAAALADGGFRDAPYTAYAVTPELRAALGTDDEEELEYAAMGAAAEEAARLLAASPDTPARRVVLAAQLADRVLRPAAAPLPHARCPGATSV